MREDGHWLPLTEMIVRSWHPWSSETHGRPLMLQVHPHSRIDTLQAKQGAHLSAPAYVAMAAIAVS
jgi:hypothetical protein